MARAGTYGRFFACLFGACAGAILFWPVFMMLLVVAVLLGVSEEALEKMFKPDRVGHWGFLSGVAVFASGGGFLMSRVLKNYMGRRPPGNSTRRIDAP